MEENIVKQEVPKKNNTVTIILAILVVLLSAALVYVLFFKKEEKPVDKVNPTPTATENTNTNTDTSTNIPEGISKQIVTTKTCENKMLSLNNVTVELKNAKMAVDSIGCEGELYINGTRVNDTNEFGIDSFEIFNKHVIVSYGSSNGGFITIYDTNNLDKPYHVELKDYYSPMNYVSDDNGIIITAFSTAEMSGAPAPKYYYEKVRVKYENSSFTSMEVIEKYNEN